MPAHLKPTRRWLTAVVAARLLHRSERTIRRQCAQGLHPGAHKVLGTWLLLRRSVTQMRQKVTGDTPIMSKEQTETDPVADYINTMTAAEIIGCPHEQVLYLCEEGYFTTARLVDCFWFIDREEVERLADGDLPEFNGLT